MFLLQQTLTTVSLFFFLLLLLLALSATTVLARCSAPACPAIEPYCSIPRLFLQYANTTTCTLTTLVSPDNKHADLFLYDDHCVLIGHGDAVKLGGRVRLSSRLPGLVDVRISGNAGKDVGSLVYGGKRYGGKEDYRTHCYRVEGRRACEMMFVCEANSEWD